MTFHFISPVAVVAVITLTTLVTPSASWQIVEELCETTEIATLLKEGHWCSETVPRCQWQGITCDAEDNFVGIELRNVPLNVPIPDKIDAPGKDCLSVKLVNCGLTGEVPPTMELTRLHTFDVSQNQLTGNLPWTWVSKLNHLNVAENQMAGAAELTEKTYTYMQHLILAGNGFYENLNKFSALSAPKMKTFDISSNKFVGRAPGFNKAVKYNISYNFFSDIEPAEILEERIFGERPLEVCDTAGNPFRLEPPNWMQKIYERCRYNFDPSNEIYIEKDFEPTTTTTTTTTAEAVSSSNEKDGIDKTKENKPTSEQKN